MLILSLLHDFRGTWQAHKQRLCGGLIRRCAACRWLVSVPALPTNRWRLNVNQGEIKHAAPTAGLTCILQSVQITKKKIRAGRPQDEDKNTQLYYKCS